MVYKIYYFLFNNITFNRLRRLTHSHLPIIVGEYYSDEKNALEALANVILVVIIQYIMVVFVFGLFLPLTVFTQAPDPSGNVIWITNRQQKVFFSFCGCTRATFNMLICEQGENHNIGVISRGSYCFGRCMYNTCMT